LANIILGCFAIFASNPREAGVSMARQAQSPSRLYAFILATFVGLWEAVELDFAGYCSCFF
jgi:hypothetical protein